MPQGGGAKLCRKADRDLEQIKFLLDYSIQTTKRYLKSEQEIAIAVNDSLGSDVAVECICLFLLGAALSNQGSGMEVVTGYQALLRSVSDLLRDGRRNAATSVNAVLTSTYWLVGRRLVEFEQGGKERAAYGSELLKRLSRDLQSHLGRGFSERNLEQMRQFYLQWIHPQTLSADSKIGAYSEHFADSVCEIGLWRRAGLPTLLVPLRASTLRAGSHCQAAL